MFFLTVWNWVHLVLRPLFCLLYQLQMIDDDCGADGEMRIDRGNRRTRRKPALVPLCLPQISHDLTRSRTRASVVRRRRLTAWTMARPFPEFISDLPSKRNLQLPWNTKAHCLFHKSLPLFRMLSKIKHSHSRKSNLLQTHFNNILSSMSRFLSSRFLVIVSNVEKLTKESIKTCFRVVPPKSRFTQDLHGATSQKTAFFTED
jgi:hypothetical protein